MSESPDLRDLADYQVSRITGFVPEVDPLVAMPDAFAEVGAIADDLPGLMRWERVRDRIRKMAEPDIALATDQHMQERLFLALSVLTNAWVWQGNTPDLDVPPQLARPVCTLAETLGRQPIVSHASMSLWNWRRIDPQAPVSVENAELLVRFLGGADETWFFTSALGVELAGASAVGDLADAARASAKGDAAATEAHLGAVADRMEPINAALERVRDWCDPHVFYLRVRPFLAGWPAPGAVYHGVSDDPVTLAGGSAGQSALIQAFDAAMGVTHAGVAGAFLSDMRRYMPALHRQFLRDLGAVSKIRELAIASDRPALREAYDTVIAGLDQFRRRHMGLAMDYVVKPSGEAATLGTGGTEFTEFLRDARLETARQKLG